MKENDTMTISWRDTQMDLGCLRKFYKQNNNKNKYDFKPMVVLVCDRGKSIVELYLHDYLCNIE